MSLKNLLIPSRTLKVIRNHTVEYGTFTFLLIFRCNYSLYLRYSPSNGVYFKSVLGGHSVSLETTPFGREHTSSYWPSTVIAALSYIFSYIKRYIYIYVGIRNFIIPNYIRYPVRGSPSEYCHKVWSRKTSVAWLPDIAKVWGYAYSFRYNIRT